MGCPAQARAISSRRSSHRLSGSRSSTLPADAHDDLSDPVWSKAFERADALEPELRQSKGQDAKSDQLRRSVANAIRATGRRTGAPVLLDPRELLCGAAAAWPTSSPAQCSTPSSAPPQSSSSHGVTNPTAPPWPSRPSFPTHRLRPLTVDQSAEYLTRRIGAAPEPSVLGGALARHGWQPGRDALGLLVPLRRAAARIGPVSRSCADRTRTGRSVRAVGRGPRVRTPRLRRPSLRRH